MLNILLISFVLIVLLLLIKSEHFQTGELLPINTLITPEKIVCKGQPGEQGPQGPSGKFFFNN
jgi:hypothetical protein